MKRLLLVRHAKSSWKDAEMPDFERPLNKRGERDAPAMGARLASRKVRPDGLISSGALRAITTARALAEAMGYPADRIVVDDGVYGTDAGDLLALIRKVDNAWESVMVVGHNPTMTDLINALTDTIIDNMPTCGVAEIVFDGDDWAKIDVGAGRVVAFDCPKHGD